MEKEDKELLLKDLSARLPYGVIIHSYYRDYNDVILIGFDFDKELVGCIFRGTAACFEFSYSFKPYLRPMSSMTEEEKREYDKLFTIHSQGETYCENWEWFDFMNSHHFDYRGLIEKGLALEAPKDMYNIKKK